MSKRRVNKPRMASLRAIRREISLMKKHQKSEGTYGTPPADLAGLRALVEAVDKQNAMPPRKRTWGEILYARPAAREALERMEAEHRNCVTQFAYDAVCGANAKQTARLSTLRRDAETFTARLARLEGALAKIMPSIMLLRPVIGGPWLDTWEREARAILEGHPTDAATAEWQRVHGAAAQAARDLAHWRKRAEAAEARLARENRDA